MIAEVVSTTEANLTAVVSIMVMVAGMWWALNGGNK